MNHHLKPNYVAILPDTSFQSIGDIEVVDVFNPHLNYRVTGKVVACCDKLQYNGYEKLTVPTDNEYDLAYHRELVSHSTEWHTDLEVEIGDTVYFRLVNLLEPSDPKYSDQTIIIDGEVSILMPYIDLIAKVEGDRLHPLNGYILVEPIIHDNNIGIFEVPEKRSVTEGVVKFVGKPNAHYILYPEASDMLNVQVGNKVAYPKTSPVRIETESYKQFGKFTALDRLQRRHLLGILK